MNWCRKSLNGSESLSMRHLAAHNALSFLQLRVRVVDRGHGILAGHLVLIRHQSSTKRLARKGRRFHTNKRKCNGEAAASLNYGIPSIKDFRNLLEDIIGRFLALPVHLPQTTGRKRGCRNARLQVSLAAKLESQQVGRMDHSLESPS
jgi:hypothetical protein